MRKIRNFMRLVAMLLIVVIGFNSLNININTVQSNTNKFNTFAVEQANAKSNNTMLYSNSANMISNMISNDHFQNNQNISANVQSLGVDELTGGKGEIYITYTANDPIDNKELELSNVAWKLYRVLEFDIDNIDNIKPTTNFANFEYEGGEFGEYELNTQNVTAYSKALVEYAEKESIRPNGAKETDANGKSSIENLPNGIYVLQFEDKEILIDEGTVDGTVDTINDNSENEEDEDEIAGYNYYSDPILVSIPGFQYNSSNTIDDVMTMSAVASENGYWSYVQEVVSKVTYSSIVNTPSTSVSTVNVNVEKTWNDNGFAVQNPSSVEVGLYADDVLYNNKKATLNTSNNWKTSWSSLPYKDASNKVIDWTVKEHNIPAGYTDTITFTFTENPTNTFSFNIENTYNIDLMEVNVEKIWDDNNNSAGERPTKVEVELYKGDKLYDTDVYGNAVTTPVVLNASNNWKHTWQNLEERDDWHVKEIDNLDGYILSSIEDPNDDFNFEVTNTYQEPDKIDVSVKKVWDDGNDVDGLRPLDVTVGLYNKDTGQLYQDCILKNSNNWEYTWANLDPDINWTVKEISVPADYEDTIEFVKDNNGNYSFTVTNFHEPEIPSFDLMMINVEKEWNDNNNQDRPVAVIVELLQDDVFYNDPEVENPVTLNNGNQWKHSWEDLEVRDDWDIREVDVPDDYHSSKIKKSSEITSKMPTVGDYDIDFELTNTYISPDLMMINVQKEWDDNNNPDRPVGVIVELHEDGVLCTDPNIDAIVELNDDNFWEHSWYNLSKESEWNVHEQAVDDYEVGKLVTSPDDNTYMFTIDNTLIPEEPTLVDASVTKIWLDDNNEDKKRPDDVTVGLYSNDGKDLYEKVTLDDTNSWYYEWSDLEDLDWSIKEIDVPYGYTSAITNLGTNGDYAFQVKNTYKKTEEPFDVFLKVEKIWDDKNDYYGERPEKITVGLYSDLGTTLHYTKELNASNGWSHMWFNLPDLDWTIKEIDVDGYVTNINHSPSTNGYFVELTNTYKEPYKISVDVKKTWNDNNNVDGQRPDYITVGLFDGNGKLHGSIIKLNKGNNWKYTWTNLDPDVDWKVEEIYVPSNYLSLIKDITASNSDDLSFEIVNTYLNPPVETANIEVKKVWSDNGDFFSKRPEDVEIGLYNGNVLYDKVVLGADNGWYYEWDNLEILDWNIKEIDAPDGYRVSYSSSGFYYEVKNAYIVTLPAYPETPETPDDPDDPETPKTPDDPETPNIPGTPTPGTPTTPGTPNMPTKVDIGVKKVWNNDRGNFILNVRPVFIEAILYRNGEIFDKVILSDSNNWQYEWKDMDTAYEWDIKEADVPVGYEDTYVQDGFHFTIQNGYIVYPPGKIPQTGVEWTLSLLSGFGLILLSIGLMIDNRLRKNEVAVVGNISNRTMKPTKPTKPIKPIKDNNQLEKTEISNRIIKSDTYYDDNVMVKEKEVAYVPAPKVEDNFNEVVAKTVIIPLAKDVQYVEDVNEVEEIESNNNYVDEVEEVSEVEEVKSNNNFLNRIEKIKSNNNYFDEVEEVGLNNNFDDIEEVKEVKNSSNTKNYIDENTEDLENLVYAPRTRNEPVFPSRNRDTVEKVEENRNSNSNQAKPRTSQNVRPKANKPVTIMDLLTNNKRVSYKQNDKQKNQRKDKR